MSRHKFQYISRASHGNLHPDVFQLLTEKLDPPGQWGNGAEIIGTTPEATNTLPRGLLDMVRQHGGIGSGGVMNLNHSKEQN